MRKIALFVALSMFATLALGQTPPNDDDTDWEEIILIPKPKPKSVAENPISAWYNHELCMIRLETDGKQGPIVVSVEDEAGRLAFQQVVDGNQINIKISLQSLLSGHYILTIENSVWLFAGKFEVY